MANTLLAFFNKDDLVDRLQLQQSIDELGFDLQLDEDFQLYRNEGFVPCTLNGESGVGFEHSYEDTADIQLEEPSLAALVQDKTRCFTLSWHSSFKDFACAQILCCALVKHHQAVVSFEGNLPESYEAMLAAVKDALSFESQPTQLHEGEAQPQLKALLHTLAGSKISDIGLFGGLALSFDAKVLIRAKAFCLNSEHHTLDFSQYSQLRAQQIAIMYQSTDGTYTDAQQAQLAEIEVKLEQAGSIEENNEQTLNELISSWPDELLVNKVELSNPNSLTLYFDNLKDTQISLFAFDGMLSDILIKSQDAEFKITDKGCEFSA